MLEELRIRNFAIIDNLELEFAPGFNVITGETGAGKSIIIDAVELLLGSKADADTVRAEKEKAVIEGVFALGAQPKALLVPLLRREDLLEEGAGFITLTREIRRNGRSTARINGITVSADILRQVGQTLVDIHGQSEHLSLLRPRHHINLLDRYADLLEVRVALAKAVGNLGTVRDEIKRLMEDEAELQRRAEQLRRDVEEINAAAIQPDEDDELREERTRLANSEQLAVLAGEAVQLLNGDEGLEDQTPAVDRLQRVATILGKLAEIDSGLQEDSELAESISDQAQELALSLGRYADTVEFNPQRLNEVEERLELIGTFKRRFGVNIEAVLEHAENARAELETIEHSEERLEELRAKEDKLLHNIGDLSRRISKVRKTIGGKLSKKVVQELTDLRMERTRFEVSITQQEDPNGCYVNDKRMAFDITGIDKIEFLMSANPGEPLRPLVKVASGGETSRIMLALKRVLTQADQTPTLIFDEIDQGIGGRVGAIVGEKLWMLSEAHQVLVVTHLPQLAGFADKHYNVRKVASQRRTLTEVVPLDSDNQRAEELANMLGTPGETGKQNASDILAQAKGRKEQLRTQ